VSAHSPLLALGVATICVAMWTAARARRGVLASEVEWLEHYWARRWAWVVAAIAVTAAAVTAIVHTFSATGADASGYLSYASVLLEERLTYSEPLASVAKWADGPATLAPLGWRVGMHPDEQVPTYAIGLPLLLAPFLRLLGDAGAALVIPACFAVAIGATGAIAHRVAGPAAAIMAATLLATSPVALLQSIQVMSDVPVTAAWLLCWLLALSQRPLSAGVAAASAILIRPNLAPLCALPLLYLARRGGLRSGGAAAVPVVLAGALVGYLQWVYFGSPLRSGYGTAQEIYSLANIVPNTLLYTRWVMEIHGSWLLAAPVALVFLRRDLAWLFAFAALVVIAYLVYAQFESWTYLRFLLPAMAIATIGVAVTVACSCRRLPAPVRVALVVLLTSALATMALATARDLHVFRLAARQERGRMIGERLAATLPVNSVFISGEQSGTLRYYTGHTIVRWDLMAPDAMPEAIEWLTLNGYQLWVVLDDWEEEAFRRKFPLLASNSIDYEPTVESAAGVPIRTRAWRVRRFIARSSNSEYATGTTTSVRNSDSVWPPMTTTAIVRRSSAPGPVPRASGSIPPTSARVVIRIGRSRSRFASRIATPRSNPCRRRLSV
jgi:hypothetical protein